MKTIWKFDLKNQRTSVTMPIHTKIIKVGYQGPNLRMWAIVDPDQANEIERDFAIVGTGQELDDEFIKHSRYIDTVWKGDGTFIWHVFETTGL